MDNLESCMSTIPPPERQARVGVSRRAGPGALRCRECRARFSPLDLICPHCGRWPRIWLALPIWLTLFLAWLLRRLLARLAPPRP
jgi:hypothetical protein